MPNWCENEFVIYGDKEQLLKFYKDMTIATSENPNFEKVDNSWDEKWVGNLFLGAGYTEEELQKRQYNYRGGVDDIVLKEDRVIIWDYTAWTPNNEEMEDMLYEKYPGLEMVYKAEEGGCGIYINTDTEGKYIPERFLVDFSSANEDLWEYYETWDEVAKVLSRISGVPADVITKMAGSMSDVTGFDWTTWLNSVRDDADDEDTYLYVSEFLNY